MHYTLKYKDVERQANTHTDTHMHTLVHTHTACGGVTTVTSRQKAA